MSLDAVFKALADPVRRELLDALHGRGGQTLAELCEGRGMTRQAVSKHLAVLEGANLVATDRRGREKLHHLNPVPIQEIADVMLFLASDRSAYTSGVIVTVDGGLSARGA